MKKLIIILTAVFVLAVCGAGVSYAGLIDDYVVMENGLQVIDGYEAYAHLTKDSNSVVIDCYMADAPDGSLIWGVFYRSGGTDPDGNNLKWIETEVPTAASGYSIVAQESSPAVPDYVLTEGSWVITASPPPAHNGIVEDGILVLNVQNHGATSKAFVDKHIQGFTTGTGGFGTATVWNAAPTAIPEPATVMIFSMIIGGFGTLKKFF